MKYILDSSVAVKWVLPEIDADKAIRLNRAIDISSSHRIGIYDCLYAALAERESVDFSTTDDHASFNGAERTASCEIAVARLRLSERGDNSRCPFGFSRNACRHGQGTAF